MNIIDAVRARKSIRGYKPAPVPKEVLREILDIASRSPSAMNAQPWDVTVVTGEVLDNIRQVNIELLTSGVRPNPEVPFYRLEGIYRQRQVDIAIQLFQLMGIAREDREKRAEWGQRGYRFFDAPVAIILSVDRSLEELKAMMDIGTFVQTVCLIALKYGLGTCLEDQGIMFLEVVREFTLIPEYKRIVISIAIGYPDWDFPANKVESKREAVENFVTWCGFD